LTDNFILCPGSSEAFNKIAGVQGKVIIQAANDMLLLCIGPQEVLYVGDHIFGDIIKSKKEQAFRFVY
jgi:hypothetical protein